MYIGILHLTFAVLLAQSDAPGEPPAPGAGLSGPVVFKPVPATQPVGEVVPADEVIAAFLRTVESNTSYEKFAKDFVANLRAKPGDSDPKSFINLSLAVLSPKFGEALGLIEKEKPAKAVDALEPLADSDDAYLAVAAAQQAAAALVELEQFERCLALLNRVRKKHNPIARFTLAADHLQFMLGYCQVHTLDYDGAQATLEDFLKRFPAAPERLRVTAVQIVTELSRRTPRKLGDVHDLMNSARRQISHGETGQPVREKQERAIAMLEDLIKEAEDQEKSNNQNNSSGGKGDQPNQNQPGGGAKQSALPGGSDKDAVLRQTRARPGDTWGKMPPKEREQVLQSIQKQFPSRYRELLEQYYRELSKDQPAP
ncbi:MAG: hypothetical protein HZA51_13210 [Planctomycetes bacterium]|nr:hypothetical protein [Planctomycetota bacterium]